MVGNIAKYTRPPSRSPSIFTSVSYNRYYLVRNIQHHDFKKPEKKLKKWALTFTIILCFSDDNFGVKLLVLKATWDSSAESLVPLQICAFIWLLSFAQFSILSKCLHAVKSAVCRIHIIPIYREKNMIIPGQKASHHFLLACLFACGFIFVFVIYPKKSIYLI